MSEPKQYAAVDEVMVDEALRSWFECDDWPSLLAGIEGVDRCRSRMLRALTAALAAQSAVVPKGTVPPSAITWHPIETAPKDNKHPLYLAQFNPDTGELIELDWDASWEAESESWEIPQVYYVWRSANDRVEEPTHWAYQNIPAQQPAAVDGAARRRDVRLWMRHNAGSYSTATELAEAADEVFSLPDGGLDNETHWVWDEAAEAVDDSQRGGLA